MEEHTRRLQEIDYIDYSNIHVLDSFIAKDNMVYRWRHRQHHHLHPNHYCHLHLGFDISCSIIHATDNLTRDNVGTTSRSSSNSNQNHLHAANNLAKDKTILILILTTSPSSSNANHYHLHAANNLAKDNMLSIEPGGGGSSDEELGPICVRPLVRHRQQTRPRNIGI